MTVKLQLAVLMTALSLAGCAEEQQPQHVKMFEGATNTVAPATGYYSSPPPSGPIVYYLSLPEKGQEPDGELNERQKFDIIEEGEEYVKVRFGEVPEPGAVIEPGDLTGPIEAYIHAKFIPDGRFAAGTKVEVLKKTESYVKIRTGDGLEVYVKPRFIKKISPEG